MMLYKLIIHTHESEASALHVTQVSAQCLPRHDEFVLFERDGATLLAKVFDVVHDVAPQRNPDEMQCPVTVDVIVHARIGGELAPSELLELREGTPA